MRLKILIEKRGWPKCGSVIIMPTDRALAHIDAGNVCAEDPKEQASSLAEIRRQISERKPKEIGPEGDNMKLKPEKKRKRGKTKK